MTHVGLGKFCALGLVAVLMAGVASAQTDVGTLASDGTTITFTGSLASGELYYYTFTLTDDITDVAGTYLNIQTYGVDGMSYMDTMIGLYDSSGQLVAYDDDDNSESNTEGDYYNLYSLLSFGPSDPYYNDGYKSSYGSYLSAGTYTLVVAGFYTTFTSSIDDIVAGTDVGDYVVQFSSVSTETPTVPVPSAVALLGFGVMNVLGLRKKFARR